MNARPFAMLVHGQPITTNKSFPVINPATEDGIAEALEADAASDQLALTSARGSFKSWSRMAESNRTVLAKTARPMASEHT